MGFKHFNPNPRGVRVGDCAVRACCAATGQSWEHTHIALCLEAFCRGDMPSADHVWGAYLKRQGFRRRALDDVCPDCYTTVDFCRDHPRGVYVLAFGGHVACVIDGDVYDTWDSGGEVPAYYYEKGEQ